MKMLMPLLCEQIKLGLLNLFFLNSLQTGQRSEVFGPNWRRCADKRNRINTVRLHNVGRLSRD